MSKSNRLTRFAIIGAIVAALIMLFAWSGQPQYLGDTEAPSTEGQSKSNNNTSNGPRSVTCNQDCQVHFGAREDFEGEDANYHAGNRQAESKGTQYTREGLDLLAQRKMAYWSVWIAGFTLVGLMLLAGTFYEAFKATSAAKTAADAAKIQAQAAINASRAYITLIDPGFRTQIGKNLSQNGVHGKMILFDGQFSNRGLGTGFLKYWHTRHELTPTDKIDRNGPYKQHRDMGLRPIGVDATWGFGLEAALVAFTLTDQEVAEIQAKSLWLHIYGYATYIDLFGVERQSGFHFSYNPDEMSALIETDQGMWFDRVVEKENGSKSTKNP